MQTTQTTRSQSRNSQPARSSTAQTPAQSANGPTHRIFHVRDRGADKKAFWQEVGVGFVNRDGSISLKLNYVPASSGGDALSLQLRIAEPRDAGEANAAGSDGGRDD